MDVPGRYRRFALNEAAKHSEIYADWALHVADDRQICSLIAGLPPEKRQPNLLFACARLVGAQPGPYANLRRILVDQWDAVAAQIAVRSTQTNEPARDAILLPLWAQLPEPLFLIELGAAAGLGLHPQAWRYRYESAGRTPDRRPGVPGQQPSHAPETAAGTTPEMVAATTREPAGTTPETAAGTTREPAGATSGPATTTPEVVSGTTSAPAGATSGATVVVEGGRHMGSSPELMPYPAGEFVVQVRPASVGHFSMPDHMPRIAGRVGVDRTSLDPRDADAQAWLRTLIWPEQTERLTTLKTALQVASADPVPVLSGDLTDPTLLERLLALAPAGSTPVIWHSAVLAYLAESDRAVLEERLRALVRAGRAHWISYEGQQVVPGIWARVLSQPPWRAALRRGAFVVSLGGEPCYQADGHARWIR